MEKIFRIVSTSILMLTILYLTSSSSYAKILGTPKWQKLNLANPPKARTGYAQVYDAKRNILTIFGGDDPFSTSFMNYAETWQADLNTMAWQKIETSVAPEGRSGCVGVIDSCHDRMYIYGGASYDTQGYPTLYSDIWEFDLNTLKWTKLAPIVGVPWHFDGGSLIFDSKEHRLLYFGGYDFDFRNLKNETWAYSINDNKWSKLAATGTPPSPREGTGAAYDPVNHRLIILNGCEFALEGIYAWYKPLDELWELDLSTLVWKRITFSIKSAPSARKAMGFNYIPKEDRLIVFGGDVSLTYTSNYSNELWQFELATQKWTLLHPDGDQVSARGMMITEYDIVRSRILLFGGWDNSSKIHNDLYELLLSPEAGIKINDELLSNFILYPNYPNPFNPTTAISYDLPDETKVRIDIFNILGEKVFTLVDENKRAGHYTVTWNGRDSQGRMVTSGIYIYRMEAGSFSQTRRMLFLQ